MTPFPFVIVVKATVLLAAAALVDAGLRHRGSAAALITAGTDSAAYQRHAERARAGAKSDALLAKNLSHIS